MPHAPWKVAVWGQFGAAIDSLEAAIDACPEHVWGDRARQPEYWYIVYHTLFFLDYNLADSEAGFAPPPPFTLSELDPTGVLPDRVYSRDEMRRYLAHGRERCRARIREMNEAQAAAPCGFNRRNMSRFEHLIHSLRHVQHHTAQLNLMLRQAIDSAPGWVFRARVELSDRGGE
jgi:hypothetical protein